MASTTFIDNQTTIYASWLNDVNNAVYNGVFASTSLTATNMICTGTASGVGFTNLINNVFSAPGAIGSATPNTGAFTTLTTTTPIGIASGGTGLGSVGTSGFALASNGSALVYKKLGLGMTGESWNNVAGSRSINTTYTNSNAYPIQVSVFGYLSVTGVAINFVVNGLIIGQIGGGNANCQQGGTFIVPPSATYSTNGTGFVVSTWSELY